MIEGTYGYGRCLSCEHVWELEGFEEETCEECGCTFPADMLREHQTINAELEGQA